MASTSFPITHPTTYNYSISVGIPAAFLLGIVPHSLYLVRLMQATKNQQSNAMPRTNLSMWKDKLPSATWSQLNRLRGAHLNSMEVFPLFAAAVLAGNVAKVPAEEVNNMTLTFLGLRTLYIGMYASIKGDVMAFARTGIYTASIGVPLLGLWRAGKVFAEQDV